MLQQNGATPLPEFFVGKTITNERITNFMENKHGILSEALGKPETKAIWYSRDHVAKWLFELDKAGADGMRVYFGAYGENDTYANQLCLQMVLTIANPSTGGHNDITIEDATDFTDRSIEPGKTGSKDRDLNTGSPCPPICDGGMDFPQ